MMPINLPVQSAHKFYLVERIQVSLVGTERTLHGLGAVVATELPRHVDRLLRKHLKDLFAVRGAGERLSLASRAR